MKLGKITPMEILMFLTEGGHLIKTIQGEKELKKKFDKVAEEFKKGNMKTVEKILTNVDINGFIDENLYSDALAEIDTELKNHLDNLMYKLAKGTREEQTLARNVIACVATNSKPERRIKMVEEMANCKTLAALKKLIYARGWDRPDAPIINLITVIKEKMLPEIGKGFETAGEGIKIAMEKFSTATENAFQEMNTEAVINKSMAFKERMKQKYEGGI